MRKPRFAEYTRVDASRALLLGSDSLLHTLRGNAAMWIHDCQGQRGASSPMVASTPFGLCLVVGSAYLLDDDSEEGLECMAVGPFDLTGDYRSEHYMTEDDVNRLVSQAEARGVRYALVTHYSSAGMRTEVISIETLVAANWAANTLHSAHVEWRLA